MALPDLSEAVKDVFLLGLILYGVTFLLTIVAALRHVCKLGGRRKLRRCTVAGQFYVLVGLFLMVRIAWTAVQLFSGVSRQYLQFGLNVLSDCLFFSCFSLIVIHWAQSNSKTTFGETVIAFNSMVGWVFLAVNVVLYAFQTIVIVYIVVKDDASSPLVLTSILLGVLENVIVGVAFFGFGLRLYCVIQNARSTIADPATLGQSTSVRKSVIITLLMTACFLSRGVLYIVQLVRTRKVSGDEMMAVDTIPRLVLIYVSELAPIIYQLWLQRARKKLEEKHDRFIEDLYFANEADQGDTAALDTEPLLDTEQEEHVKTIN